MLYVANAFSLNMLSQEHARVVVDVLSLEEAKEMLQGEFKSCVGHADTAKVLSSQLGKEVEFARVSLTLSQGDELLVGQFSGTRLPEGATSLPEGAQLKWVHLQLK